MKEKFIKFKKSLKDKLMHLTHKHLCYIDGDEYVINFSILKWKYVISKIDYFNFIKILEGRNKDKLIQDFFIKTGHCFRLGSKTCEEHLHKDKQLKQREITNI